MKIFPFEFVFCFTSFVGCSWPFHVFFHLRTLSSSIAHFSQTNNCIELNVQFTVVLVSHMNLSRFWFTSLSCWKKNRWSRILFVVWVLLLVGTCALWSSNRRSIVCPVERDSYLHGLSQFACLPPFRRICVCISFTCKIQASAPSTYAGHNILPFHCFATWSEF